MRHLGCLSIFQGYISNDQSFISTPCMAFLNNPFLFSLCIWNPCFRISLTFVSNVIFVPQLYNRYMLLHLVNNLLRLNFSKLGSRDHTARVNIKQSRQFPHSHVSIVATSIIGADGF